MSNWMENAKQAPTEDSLAVVARVVQAIDAVNEDIGSLEAELKDRSKQKSTLETTLAETLSKHRLTELKLQDGRNVVLSEDLKAKLPADPVKRQVVLQFVRNHGGADIIKDKLTLLNPSDALVDSLVDRGEDFDRKSEIHYQTLVAFFREQLGMSKGSIASVTVSDIPPEAGLFMTKKISIR